MLRIIGDDGSRHSPRVAAEDWRLVVSGAVEDPCELSLEDLLALQGKPAERRRGITCVSAANIVQGGGPVTFAGVAFRTLLDRVFPGGLPRLPEDPTLGPTVELLSRAPGTVGPRSLPHSTHLTLEDCLEPEHGLLLATHLDGSPLPYSNGGPLRAVAPPHLFFYKSVKWLAEIRWLDRPLAECRGTWEEHSGYHNRARIDLGERFEPRMRWILGVRPGPDGGLEDETELVPSHRWQPVFEECWEKRVFSRLVAAQLHKMFGKLPRDFRGSRFSDGDYHGKVRGTSFASADLTGALCAGCNFSLSKFTNVRFSDEGRDPADLSGCDFEGAFFNKAYLENVDMRGANLSNTTFFGTAEADRPSDRVRGLDLRGAINLAAEAADWLARGGALLS
ncbi:MAG: molybdopterin-dependent oxidoreductase [Acidobacteria bacterium]|nr:molybdopterin-dependent oxidoreductase [Acidobacteriota bacterium]